MRRGKTPAYDSKYQHLDGGAVRDSTADLHGRIQARFPGSGLSNVCASLVSLLDEIISGKGIRHKRVRAARVVSRVGMVVVTLIFGVAVASAAASIVASPGSVKPLDWLPLLETVVNDLVFAGIAFLFLRAMPQRLERARVLRVLYRLRSLAHVIDMHQITKVPERVKRDPQQEDGLGLTPQELRQYFEYCTEMLSLVSKAAALYAENTSDGEVLDVVGGIEMLISGMSRKVWQKITILQFHEG